MSREIVGEEALTYEQAQKSTAVRCPRPVTLTCVTIACMWVRVTLCVTSTAWGRRKRSFVMEDWEPTEHFLQCMKEARHE